MIRLDRIQYPVMMYLSLCCIALPAFAGDKPVYDRVQLSAQAQTEVRNDTLVAVLTTTSKGEDIADLSEQVNRIMSKAVKQAKQVKGVNVQTLDYQTRPVYEKQHQTGWQVSQSMQLKSQDSKALSSLLGELQKNLMLVSMTYEVSAEQREQAQESLIVRAIAAFEQRARHITRALHRKRYRLVHMQVNTAGSTVKPVLMRAQANYAGARQAPPVEAGSQQITVTVTGEIELELN